MHAHAVKKSDLYLLNIPIHEFLSFDHVEKVNNKKF
jgi:hypothetical protein